MYKILLSCFSLSLIFSFSSLTFGNEAILISTKVSSTKKDSYNTVLYINPKCGYCKKVTDYLNKSNRFVVVKNTQDPEVRGELVRIGGKSQIPCLVINGQALYESDAIIDWFKTHP